MEFEVVQGERADGFGVDLDEAPEVFVFQAEPLYDLLRDGARADRLSSFGGGVLLCAWAEEVVDKVPVVAVEGGVRDIQRSFDGAPPEYSIGRLTCRYRQPAWRCDGWLAGCP